ncbi:MAG TPA: cysteine desulfurase [Balneola sp.]|nr:cysteine desulfurase [Bacteroidota bacterium]MAB66560.1 cysteine desulfurase [Bacteroidota bacterium]HCT54169.1 cysteine desulfurase [Balneola sp.]|tara:strand:+ start:1154 stop:2293 length:1140 start_codon:yes stop_codon:yes gene_type:complete
MIYLDHAATTPTHDTALEVFVNVSKHYYGNPSSLHDIGAEAKQLLEASRRTLAKILNAETDEIIFTGGGSESNQLAIKALLSSVDSTKNHLIVSEVEHSSVRNLFEQLERSGFIVSKIGVDSLGRISINELENLITERTALISIQHANSETGVIQDVEKIGLLTKKHGLLFHSDCVQTFCKIGIESKWFDAVSVSSHKVYGPKGVGAFYLSKSIDFKPEVPGTSQEKGIKAGTQNVAGIASFATAAKLTYANRADEYVRLTMLRSKIIDGFKNSGIECVDEGSTENKLSNILGLRFVGMEGQFLMLECSQTGLAISTGSACQVGSEKPNRTMKAMGRTDEEAIEFVRLSLGSENNEEQIDVIIQKIEVILNRHFAKAKF